MMISQKKDKMNHLLDETHEPLPSGTVTFLFTDIENSTLLAKSFPGQMPALIERHHTILRESIQNHHGYVFQIVGDGFCAAFHTALDALCAAVAAQQLLQHENWAPVTLLVRMGIHTGAAQIGVQDDRSGGYRGYLTLARVQRVMSSAHGGQVLLSSASAELVRGQLPDGITLLDMGECRLKGGMIPEHLWQIAASDLRSEFPPVLSLNAIPNNLPSQPTAIIGREVELSEVVKRLGSEGVRLLTLTGPGGIGKTRVALQTAAELIDGFKDGVYFVDLASIIDPEHFPTVIARTLGFRETSGRPLLEDLKAQLNEKKMLLLLDNFEQVTAAATQVADLLRDCPNLKLLVTSREALRVRGEYVFPVPPLALPKFDLKHPSIEQLTQYEAVRLFIERAQAVKPDFLVTNENAPYVAEICWRLDGLPLAIELAAARVRLFSPQALQERLGSRLKLLRGGARDLPVRQQTLRDAIDWSYELLDAGEKRLFELLSVFQGCTFEAVEATAGGVEVLDDFEVDVFEVLSSLVDKSLIRQVNPETGEPRLVMLETIREFAAERLDEDLSFRAAVRRAHASYYAEFTRRQWERLTSSERAAALLELISNIENVRAAWEYWVVERDLEKLGKFVDSLWLLYDTRGWYHAMITLSNDLLNILSTTPSTPELAQQEMVLRTSLARALLATKGYTPEVEEAYNRALELSQTTGELPQMYPVLRGLFSFYSFRGEFDKGVPIGEKILELAERYNDANMHIEGHYVLGTSLAFIGKMKPGFEHLEKAIADIGSEQYHSSHFRVGNYPGVSSLITSALLLWGLGYPDRALERANKAVDMVKKINHPYSLAYALFHTGFLHFWRREVELSLACAQAVLDVAEQYELQIWHAVGICLYAAGIAHLGKPEEGLSHIQVGMDLYQGLKSPPIFWPLLRGFQAEICGLAGKPAQGLALLDEMMSIPSQGYGKVISVDFFRLKADLLLALSPDNLPEAEMLCLQALEIAQEQGASMLELRAALSLNKLWMHRDKAERGKQILRTAYEKLTEGFTTADLIEAKNLLEQN
jgi:predicted ATPase/class 3 adenylate cyclase